MKSFSAGSVSESLNSLQGSEALASGCVNLIVLDAIEERAGPLWARKRELVWDFTEKKLRDKLGPHDLILRVDDTTFLVAVVTDYAAAAQAVCLRVLEEVLLHFIGRVDRADIRLRRVEHIDGHEISSSDLDINRIPKLEDAPRAFAEIRPSPAREREKNPLLFTSLSGRDLRIDFSPQPVVSLKHGVLTALHLSQTVVDVEENAVLTTADRDALTDHDLALIDAATLDYASLFTIGNQDAGYVALVIPVSYRTLLNRRGRAALMAAGAGSMALKTGGLFEIIDLDIGTPPSRIGEAVALARTLCRGVFARLPDKAGSLAPFSGIGFAGLTVPLSRQGSKAIAAAKVISLHGEGLKKAFKALIALDAPVGSTARLLGMGFTHASEKVKIARNVQLSPDQAPGPTG